MAQQIVKDPYSFPFLSLAPDAQERDLERGLTEHLRALILELGKGFAFVGSQYRIQVAGHDYYLDLLFYHLRLRCFVAFELKIEEFKPEFAGKMNFYLRRNAVIVEYALRDTSKPMGVVEYNLSTALPKQLRRDLPTARELAPRIDSWLEQRPTKYSTPSLP